jgi:carbon-monoxide dehydrogenase large subunit
VREGGVEMSGHSGPSEAKAARRFVGASVPRREDPRMLTGRGRFVDDIRLPGLLHAQFVRSRWPPAWSPRSTCPRCSTCPGVVAAYTAADLDLVAITAVLDRPRTEFVPTDMPILARDRVRFVGEPLAIVIAEDPYAAEDGIEAAAVTYQAHTPVTSAEQALARARPSGARRGGEQRLVDVSMFATEGIDEVFAAAPCVVRVDRPGPDGRTRCRWRRAGRWPAGTTATTAGGADLHPDPAPGAHRGPAACGSTSARSAC